jgi:hypothetical protein
VNRYFAERFLWALYNLGQKGIARRHVESKAQLWWDDVVEFIGPSWNVFASVREAALCRRRTTVELLTALSGSRKRRNKYAALPQTTRRPGKAVLRRLDGL